MNLFTGCRVFFGLDSTLPYFWSEGYSNDPVLLHLVATHYGSQIWKRNCPCCKSWGEATQGSEDFELSMIRVGKSPAQSSPLTLIGTTRLKETTTVPVDVPVQLSVWQPSWFQKPYNLIYCAPFFNIKTCTVLWKYNCSCTTLGV